MNAAERAARIEALIVDIHNAEEDYWQEWRLRDYSAQTKANARKLRLQAELRALELEAEVEAADGDVWSQARSVVETHHYTATDTTPGSEQLLVTAPAGDELHLVNLPGIGWTCECEDFRNAVRTDGDPCCKHLVALQMIPVIPIAPAARPIELVRTANGAVEFVGEW